MYFCPQSVKKNNISNLDTHTRFILVKETVCFSCLRTRSYSVDKFLCTHPKVIYQVLRFEDRIFEMRST